MLFALCVSCKHGHDLRGDRLRGRRSTTVQNAQRVASSGIELLHSGQIFVGVAGSGLGLNRSISRFTGRTTK